MKVISFLLFALSFSTTVYAEFNEQRSVAAMKEIQTNKSAIIIDLRSVVEYEENHINRAIHVNYSDLTDWLGKNEPSEKASIVLYCELGNLSAKGKSLLNNAGFKNVIDAGSYEGLVFVLNHRL